MKKFLSVLLALAVAFTFTFGSTMSAFAAPTEAEKYATAVSDAQTTMAKVLDDYGKSLVYNQEGKLASNTSYSKTAIDKTIADVKADYNARITTAAATAFNDGTWDEPADTNAVKAVYTSMNPGTEVFTTFAGNLNAYAIAEEASALETAVNAIVVTDYAISKQADLKADIETYTGYVTAAKNAAKNKTATETDIDDVNDYIASFTDLFDTTSNVKGTTYTTPYMTVAYMNSELAAAKAKALEALSDAATDFAKAEKTRLEGIANTASNPVPIINDATAKLAKLDANVAAVKASYEAAINAIEIKDVEAAKSPVLIQAAINALNGINYASVLSTANSSTAFYEALAALDAKEALVDYAKNYAATMKTQYVETTGALKYNAATVDKALEAVIKKIQAGDTDVDTYSKIKAWLDNPANCALATADATTLLNAKAQGIADITGKSVTLDTATATPTDRNYLATNWEKDNKVAVEAIQKDYTLQIKAATSVDAITELVKAAKKAMDAYLTIAQTSSVSNAAKTQAASLGYIASPTDFTRGSLAAYADGVAAKDSANTYAAQTKADAVADAVDVLVNAVLAGQKADYTNTEIQNILKANYAAALAEIDKMKNNDTLAAEKKALEDAIAALNTNATLDNKADYIAVKKQYDEYMETAGADAPSNAPLLSAYVTKILSLEKAAVTEAINKIPATVTLADKATVEAARTALDSYVDTYKDYTGYSAITDPTLSKLTDAEGVISALTRTEVAKLIAALPETITKEDAAAVEAAKAAYDALSEEDKAIFDGQSAALVTKLEAAVKSIAALTKYDNQDAKADLLDMSRKLTIWRASKTSIRVTAVGSVKNIKANGYTVKYSFYKKNPGATSYKLIKTTTSNKYTYTNLKKGTNKFQVKVKVYDADGKLVATKMTYYRAAKIK